MAEDTTPTPEASDPIPTATVAADETVAAPAWSRKYPPLLTIAIGLLIAIFVLPSSLNLPQTNPTQTLEYAPLPPDDTNNAPPSGNLSGLGLGSSSGINGGGANGGGGAGGGPLEDPACGGKCSAPVVNVRCVGNPPRQTEDPLSPPCVSYFDGDNFGATYQGVTKDEIRILMYMDPINYVSASDPTNRNSPSAAYYDVDRDCKSYPSADQAGCNHLVTQGFKVWERYFNSRFQTYKRHVHFFVYFSDIVAKPSPDERQAEAAENYTKIKPFAVVSFAQEKYEDTYLRAMASRGVLNFGAFAGRTTAFFNEHPKLIWGYQPSVEQQADGYASYVCQKMVHKETTFGAPADVQTHKTRTFGIIHSGDPGQAGYIALADAIKQRVNDCGGNVTHEGKSTGKRGCLFQDNENTDPGYGAQTMGEFSQAGITTILYTGCTDPNWLKSAQGIGYTPEWVLLGDGELDAPYPIAQMGGANELDRHGIVITPQTFQPPLQQQRCYQAFREADANYPESDLGYVCEYYTNLFQLFVGIQVAGPRLGPTSIDKGFHAIPQRTSGDPQVPACFYNTGDYTCVKDATAMWYDKTTSRPGTSRPGCWRLIDGGNRFLPFKWNNVNAGTDWQPTGPCNGYDRGAAFVAA